MKELEVFLAALLTAVLLSVALVYLSKALARHPLWRLGYGLALFCGAIYLALENHFNFSVRAGVFGATIVSTFCVGHWSLLKALRGMSRRPRAQA